MTRSECLDEAKRLIIQDRQAEYGEPSDSFGLIAKFWNCFLGDKVKSPIEDWEVGIMMGLLKISRLRHSPNDPNGFVDLAGYAGCGCELATKIPVTEIPPLEPVTDEVVVWGKCNSTYHGLICNREIGHSGYHSGTEDCGGPFIKTATWDSDGKEVLIVGGYADLGSGRDIKPPDAP